jgi:hypothetical protein
MRLVKVCQTLKQVEEYQDHLYDEYSSVVLVSFPRFGEEGVYVWEVKP